MIGVGSEVIVVANSSSHEFKVGDKVVVDKRYFGGDSLKCKQGSKVFWLSKNEVKER